MQINDVVNLMMKFVTLSAMGTYNKQIKTLHMLYESVICHALVSPETLAIYGCQTQIATTSKHA